MNTSRSPRGFRSSTRRTRAGIVAAAAALILGVLAALPASGATADWSTYLFDMAHTSRNAAATAVTPQNATSLHKVWTWSPTHSTGQPAARLMATPTVVDGTVYIGAFTGDFYALDEATGHVTWKTNLGYSPKGVCTSKGGTTATAVVAPDPSRSDALTVYIASGNGSLYALNAATGSIVWQTPLANQASAPSEFLYAAPLLLGGNLYIGVASNCEPPLAPGRLMELSQSSGTVVHEYDAVARDSGGAGIWTTPASDGTSLWVTTGNSDETGVQPPGDSFSVVRLVASDLTKDDIWTVTSLASTDLDFGASPTLFPAVVNGVDTQMVGACDKDGYFYALDAQSLASGPIWSRKVGKLSAGGPMCLASAIVDPVNAQIVVGSNATTIGGTKYAGSIRGLNPATGAPRWQRGLTVGPIEGSPSLDGAGVIAAASTSTLSGVTNRVYLVNAATGRVLAQISIPSAEYAQPVFANGYLFVTPSTGGMRAYAP